MKQPDRSSPGKPGAVALCAAAYLLAAGAAFGLGSRLTAVHPVFIACLADLAAMVVIFAFSAALNNSSFYDPYWSVAPIPIALFWFFQAGRGQADLARQVVVMTLVTVWSLRLTYNWLRRWKGISHEDWRYVKFRRKYGLAYWPVSFLAIHLFPTALVFLGCLSLYPALSSGSRSFGALDLLATAVTAAAIWIEAAADRQLWRFVTSPKKPGQVLSTGLWAFSRHPNYFGETLYWWGLYLFCLAARPSWWWAVLGPLSISALFLFISIPMMENRMLERRPEFAEQMQRTSVFIPWFRK